MVPTCEHQCVSVERPTQSPFTKAECSFVTSLRPPVAMAFEENSAQLLPEVSPLEVFWIILTCLSIMLEGKKAVGFTEVVPEIVVSNRDSPLVACFLSPL